MTVTLAGGRVVDPATGRDEHANLCMSDGVITDIGPDKYGDVIDVSGCVVAPGLIDLHVHLREPGDEASETIETGTAAAAAGGFTAVCSMANTDPVIDSPELVSSVEQRARDIGLCDVFQAAAITKDLTGEELVDIERLAQVGVRFFTDDGHPVASSAVMREALRRAADAGITVANHAQELTLTRDAQVNEGEISEATGLPGWPHEAEEIMVARDVILAEASGASLHVQHVSTRVAVDVIRWAKSRGVSVTAEATPHHFTLTDEAARSLDPVFKVNPPLRTQDDVLAVRRGLCDGTLDVIATDHAPHADEKKSCDWRHAANGMVGLETALALSLTELVHAGEMSLLDLVRVLSHRPAQVLGLTDHGGPLRAGAPANIVVFDPTEEWTVRRQALHSRSTNTPFEGVRCRGRAIHTILRGEFVLKDRKVVRR